MSPVIVYTERGLYCPAGDFYIDPCRAVEHAVITHAHGDHLYRGSQHYYCSESSLSLVKSRLAKRALVQPMPYGKRFSMGEAILSFHPAGHILGSAQVRVEVDGETWVVSGDYKRSPDPSCEPFEVVPCDVFITETTFARPSYQWGDSTQVINEIMDWWDKNKRQGSSSVLCCYTLGKSQRILTELASRTQQPVWVHNSFEPLNHCYRKAGIPLLETRVLGENESCSLPGELILAPPHLVRKGWHHQFAPCETAFTSGWMQGEQGAYWQWNYDRGFVLSDHADWNELVQTILETGAKTVYTMPGSGRLLSRHLKQEFGILAKPVKSLKNDPDTVIQKTLHLGN